MMQRDVVWVVEFCESWFGQIFLNMFVKAKLNLFFLAIMIRGDYEL